MTEVLNAFEGPRRSLRILMLCYRLPKIWSAHTGLVYLMPGRKAPAVGWFIAARSIQGVGGAAVLACGLALLAHQYRAPAERGYVTGLWGAGGAGSAPARARQRTAAVGG